MRHYTCPCGDLEAWGSDAPVPCLACTKCGRTAGGETPVPHRWFTQTTEFEGHVAVRTFCVRCGCRKPNESPAAPASPER